MTDLLAILAGFLVGLLSGLVGLGGGVLLVPLLVIGFRFGQHAAQGTSLAAIIPTAFVGALTHHRAGNLVLRPATIMAAAGVAGALIGAALALRLEQGVLGRLFGLVLLFSAYRIWPRRRPSRPG